jgi:hypothetical protein
VENGGRGQYAVFRWCVSEGVSTLKSVIRDAEGYHAFRMLTLQPVPPSRSRSGAAEAFYARAVPQLATPFGKVL